jgi:hypothetical protein
MATGLGLLVFSYLLLGPAPWLARALPPLHWALWATQLTALTGIGVGVGLTLVPSMPHST